MTYQENDSVVLVRDLPEHGLQAGDLGAVVHVYSPADVEVEFVRVSGRTQAVVTLRDTDVRRIDGDDVVAVRSSVPPTHGPTP